MQGSAASPDERVAGTGAVVGVALIGTLLVLVSQFVALYTVRVATSSTPVKTVGAGADHGWAPIPIALVCLALVLAVFRYGNRAALLGLVALGLVTLVIALAVDLPDVHATGLIGSSAGVFQRAANRPAAGLYLETLGAVLLLVSGGVGFLMAGARPGRKPSGVRANDRSVRANDRSARANDRTARAGDQTAPVVDPGTPPGDPADPEAPPPGPKGPLTLGDRPRRRWSAS